MIPRSPLPRALLTLFVLITAAHLIVQLTGPESWSRPTQALLMPVLAAFVLAAVPRPRGRFTGLVLIALFFSWLGDTAPALASGDAAFLVMVGFFLVAQVVYVIAFWPWRANSPLYRNRTLLVPYGVVVAGLVSLCAPGVGALLVPVLVYGLLLGAMAILAVGVHRWTAVGGALFLLSDGLIALRAFTPDFDLPASGFWVMATYTAAQAFIVLGGLARVPEEPPLTEGTPA
ncbi:lysoplasmalogenase [Nocardiopsis sp. N85]|uniref:lysoplasmalogenase n=1 Tax=Nocardiopsis sp. N85 TaxID=3029400 RepID=UPI00237F457C|nr:lysoplasmalogenase [Nocardiopsis sp. N85]MDE3721703.1 lysoplasmalogenase [Nocardiopsis sp. N85]